MIFDDLKSDILYFRKNGVKNEKIINYFVLFVFNQICVFEKDIFNAEHDKQILFKQFQEMNIFYNRLTEFMKFMVENFPEIKTNEQFKNFMEKFNYDMRMASLEIQSPQLKDEINGKFCLRWFELQFLSYMSENEILTRNYMWKIKKSPTNYEKTEWKKLLLDKYNEFLEKNKYFDNLMERFENNTIKYKGVNVKPTRAEKKSLDEFKNRLRIWNVNMVSIYNKYKLFELEETDEK